MRKIIDEKQFESKLADSPKEMQIFISGLYVDPVLEEMVGEDVDDYLLIANDLADQIAYYILGLLTKKEFKENIADILYLEGSVEIEKAYDAINRYVLSKMSKEGAELTIDFQAEKDHISHIDILNEIENPTHSISTTENFEKRNVSGEASKMAGGAVQTTIQAENTTHQELGGFSQSTYQNPAQNIASKLNQKLSEPTSAAPKEVYVSKKPDPYKEPIG